MATNSAHPQLAQLDLEKLERCVELAEAALNSGNAPFGSLLTDAKGNVLFEDHNRTVDGDATRHPEFAIAKWAAEHLTPEERAASVTYTSGEHCAMCSAAHAWVGLGRIIYASSTEQLHGWVREWGLPWSPLAPLAINEVAPAVEAIGPVPQFTERIQQLQRRYRDLSNVDSQ